MESSLKGNSSAYAYSGLAAKAFVSFATQYVELDDADEYYGTFEVRTNTCLKLASDLPGTVAVANGGCLTSVGPVAIGTLSLMDGAFLDFSNGGTITVGNGFSASGTIAIEASGCASFPRALLVVPTNCGTLDARSFAGDGIRITVVVENGVQTLYAELLEPTVFDETTGYVTQRVGGTSSTSLKNVFDEPSAWSDDRIPHPDTNYYGFGKGIYINTNSMFAGRSLTIERTQFRFATGSITIPDLRVKGGTGATSSMFSSGGGAGNYRIFGGMEILSLLTENWPFAFYGGNDGQTWISSQKITGGSTRAFELRGNIGKAPGEVSNYVEFLGDLSEYFGTIIVGTNFTARLGGSVLPGTIRLDTAYSHVDTIAPNGTEVKVGKLVSRIGTSISVATTNILTITDTFSVTGTLTKNGGGVLAFCGTALAGAGASLNVAEGGLRVDAAYAVDGIPISFADGTAYVRDCDATDADLVQYGLYNEAAVTAAGTLNVDIRHFAMGAAGNAEVALFTVPAADADALATAIRFSPRPKGCTVGMALTDAGSGMKTVKAVLNKAGIRIILR